MYEDFRCGLYFMQLLHEQLEQFQLALALHKCTNSSHFVILIAPKILMCKYKVLN